MVTPSPKLIKSLQNHNNNSICERAFQKNYQMLQIARFIHSHGLLGLSCTPHLICHPLLDVIYKVMKFY